ncbi:MAG: sarcosine oxidase subunit alpha family protein [Pseudomonadota bacterium]
MSKRLPFGGRLIDWTREIKFSFNGAEMEGRPGDTLASALLANDQVLVGRSFKYHRPRGIVASGPEEPNALMNLGEGPTFEPNARATTTELFDGLKARSQNHWPSLEFDVGAINASFPLAFPAGFYYKTFISPRPAWKHIYEPFIRKAAGLGEAPEAEERDADRYEYFYAHADVMVVGGGIAGLTAALAAAKSGSRVLLMEQSAHWGGRAPVDGVEIDGKPADKWIAEAVDDLSKMPNVRMRLRMMGAGIYDHGFALGYERLSDHESADGMLRHRLWRIRAKRIITATGAIERPLSFAGNDVPGVMLASAVRDYAVNYGVGVGKRVVIATNNDDAYRTALVLKDAKVEVPCIIDARPNPTGALVEKARAAGIPVLAGKAVSTAYGGKRLTSVGLCSQDGDGRKTAEYDCDALAMSGGWSPVVHLWSHCGGKLTWDADTAMFRPNHDAAPLGADGNGFVIAAGTADGEMRTAATLANAHAAGLRAAEEAGATALSDDAGPEGTDIDEGPMLPVWQMPAAMSKKAMLKTWLDYQNDVKVSDVRLAAREGFESVEHTKRYTTLGMATDQGKLSNINGLAILADSLGADIPAVGTTTFRPPYHPISMGAIAGEARGDIFKPMRRSPMHDWIDANGGFWEPVADWRRPYCFQKPGETVKDAVTREILAVREKVGLLDASTLGKIIVKGPDAGKFLDMLYTNMMSTLKVGRCRYGLMCSENGFLSDDGVVARLDKDTFLCHTTSGGSDRIHAWMEEWLQTEWWDWQVYTVNVTEQYAQIGVVGPNARMVLEKMGTRMDLSAEGLPFMAFKDGEIGGIKARPYRISFSGELSYEVAVPANQGQAFWDKALETGAEFGITPYGTEALHVMRAEKGFIMIGDETDGTVIPQDLGLNWAISKKKEDFLGKRAQQRSFLTDPNRWKLVGLETVDPQVVIPDGAYAVDGAVRDNGVKNMIGRITSTYFSPTLNRSIAMGLVERGPDRMGEVITFTNPGGEEIAAKIVDPVFLDKEGERQNV